jgi:hypothetical protein
VIGAEGLFPLPRRRKGYRKPAEKNPWRYASSGVPYKLGGWWQVVKCKKCAKPRYVYERIGTIFMHTTRQGKTYYERKAFKEGSIGANDYMDSLRPSQALKPQLSCFCRKEP